MVRGRVAARKTSPAPQDASEAKREAVLLLETINGLLLFEEELELDGPWKKDVATEKRVLVAAIERDLRAAPQAVAKALDAQIETVQTGSRLALVAAHGQTPDPVKTQAAQARLVYLDEMRHAAALLGFGTLRSGVLATVQSHIESYVDDLITRLRVEGDLGRATIQAYLASAADLMEIVSGRNAAQLVRRRGATAVAA
jgi:hypothetical protein